MMHICWHIYKVLVYVNFYYYSKIFMKIYSRFMYKVCTVTVYPMYKESTLYHRIGYRHAIISNKIRTEKC